MVSVKQSLTHHDLPVQGGGGKKVASNLTLGSNINASTAARASIATGRRVLGGRMTAAPPNDGKLREALANYRQQLEASEHSSEVKLPRISPRAFTSEKRASASSHQRACMSLPEVDGVTSSPFTSSATSEDGVGARAAATAARPPPPLPRRLTPFPASLSNTTRSRDHHWK